MGPVIDTGVERTTHHERSRPRQRASMGPVIDTGVELGRVRPGPGGLEGFNGARDRHGSRELWRACLAWPEQALQWGP